MKILELREEVRMEGGVEFREELESFSLVDSDLIA